MSKDKRVLILINRSAGMGKAGNSIMKVVEGFAEEGYEPLVYPIIPGTKIISENIIDDYKEEFGVDEDGKIRMILCSGGDGTLNHVMNALMKLENKPILSYLPAGSTNDFAKGIGIPYNPDKALKTALHGRPFTYDIGKMNDRYFNYVAAFGAFSKVSYATDQELKNVLGYAAYILSAVAELPQNISYSMFMKVEADGIEEEGEFVFGAVSNSASVAGMTLLADEEIHQDDGKMELLLIRAPKNFAEFNAVISALATKAPDNPYITSRQVEHVRFIADAAVEWTLDGEFGGAFKETDISVINKAITIMTQE